MYLRWGLVLGEWADAVVGYSLLRLLECGGSGVMRLSLSPYKVSLYLIDSHYEVRLLKV